MLIIFFHGWGSNGDDLLGTDHDQDGCLDDSSEDLDDDNDLQGDGSDSCDPDTNSSSVSTYHRIVTMYLYFFCSVPLSLMLKLLFRL